MTAEASPESLRPVGSPRFVLCPACGSEELVYAFKIQGSRLDECLKCGLVFFNPQPTDEELDELHRQGDLLGGTDQERERRIWELRRASAGIVLRHLATYAKRNDWRGATLLDVGCGAGSLVAEAQSAGFEATGIDPSQELVEIAAKYTRTASFHHGTLDDVDLPSEYFDVIVFGDVLEHTRDPRATLTRAWELLKPSGILIAATPSLTSPSARWMRDKWIRFRPERLFYFSPGNLQAMLYRCGFGAITVHPHKKALDLQYVRDYLEKFPPSSMLLRAMHHVLKVCPTFLRTVRFTMGGTGMLMFATREENGERQLKKLSVVLPVYNERQTFALLMQELLEKKIPQVDIEIVIVESNSSDGTREEVLKLKDHPRVTLVLQEQARGKGHAVREGFEHASGDIILIQDGDLEYDIWDYDALLRPILQLDSSFTLGLRHKGNAMKMRQFSDSPVLASVINLGHRILTTTFNILYGQKLKDPFTMFKVFRKDAITGMPFECNGFDFDIELVIKLTCRGFTAKEIPVNYASRSFSEGKKVSFFSDPVKILIAMLKFRFH